jgi:sRNA-binding regulator protein Hfq
MIRNLLIALFILSFTFHSFSQKNEIYKATIHLVNGAKIKGLLERADENGLKIKTKNDLRVIKSEEISKIQIAPSRSVYRSINTGIAIGAVVGAILPFTASDDQLTSEAKVFAMVATVPICAFFGGFYASLISRVSLRNTSFANINKPEVYKFIKPQLQQFTSEVE